MTHTQRTTLAQMQDSEWYLGADLTRSGNILGALQAAGYIRKAGDDHAMLFDLWTITPDGIRAVEG